MVYEPAALGCVGSHGGFSGCVVALVSGGALSYGYDGCLCVVRNDFVRAFAHLECIRVFCLSNDCTALFKYLRIAYSQRMGSPLMIL